MADAPGPEVTYSVPRRFGVGTLLLLMTLFAAVFATVDWLETPLEDLAYGLVLLAVVLAQMVFPRAPRAASIWIGALLLPLVTLIDYYLLRPGIGMLTRHPFLQLVAAGKVYWLVVVGGFLGYLTGTVMAGVYLIRERIRSVLASKEDPEP